MGFPALKFYNIPYYTISEEVYLEIVTFIIVQAFLLEYV